MAKGQKRSNRELKKPKAVKTAPVEVVSTALKGSTTPVNMKKK